MTTKRTDAARAALFTASFLRGSDPADDGWFSIRDLLTDLRHHCDCEDFDFEELIEAARTRYAEETGEEVS